MSDGSFFGSRVSAGYWQGMVPITSWRRKEAGSQGAAGEGGGLVSGLWVRFLFWARWNLFNDPKAKASVNVFYTYILANVFYTTQPSGL